MPLYSMDISKVYCYALTLTLRTKSCIIIIGAGVYLTVFFYILGLVEQNSDMVKRTTTIKVRPAK